MATKIKDLAVKLREYTDGNGNQKAVWHPVGAVFKTDKGSYILLDRTFNPAGVANPENKDSVLISMFDPKPKEQQGSGRAPAPSAHNDDDIPF